MPFPRRAALNSATGIATVMMAIAASPARGADDPFPLVMPMAPAAQQGSGNPAAPHTAPSADYVFFVSVTINGRELPRMIKLRERAGELLIARDSLVYLGLEPPPGGAEFVVMATINGLRAEMDWSRYHLNLAARSLENPGNTIDYRRPAHPTDTQVTPVTALIVGYDLSAQASPAGLQLAGQVNTRLARENLALESGWTLALGGPDAGVVRLDTALRFDDPEHLRSLTFGDFIQTSGGDSRAVRIGGIQLSSNFALRPDFVPYPLPDFSGNLAVPQQLDLLVNDRRLSAESLQAGSFAIRNVPVSSGRGRLGVVIRDSLGREQLLALDYYASRNLLDPGVREWSVGLGRVRRRYGRASADYGPLAGSVYLRRGITTHLTLGLTGEAAEGLVNLGAEGTVTIGALAELSLGFRGSRLAQPAAQRHGHALSFNLASSGRGTSLRLSGRAVSPGYDDLASAGGDAPPNSFLALAVDFDLGKLGGVSFSAVRERDVRIGPKVPELQTRSIASLSYRNTFGRVNLFGDLSLRRFGSGTNLTAFVGLSIPLGGRAIASASFMHDRGGGNQADIGFERPAIVPGDVGYGLQVQTGRIERLRGSIAYQGPWGRVGVEAEAVNGSAASRLSARGTLVVAEGQLFALKDTSGGMVLIETGGVAGLELSRDNLPVARAGPGKRVLMADLVPRTPMRIGIVPRSLPSAAVADRQSAVVAVPGGAVSKLDLGIRAYRPELVQLLDQQGQPFLPGTRVLALPSGSETIVGFDSMVEINRASADRRLAITLGDGSTCHAELVLETAPQPVLHANTEPERTTIRCYGRVRTFPIADIFGQ